jgi:hypothetical protein
MSGESPREENRVDRNCGSSVEDPSHFSTCGVVVTALATVPTQASRQQPIACWSLGQQESCDASECETREVWQSVDIRGEIPANATTDPCRPMASITMATMSWRFIRKSLTAEAR